MFVMIPIEQKNNGDGGSVYEDRTKRARRERHEHGRGSSGDCTDSISSSDSRRTSARRRDECGENVSIASNSKVNWVLEITRFLVHCSFSERADDTRWRPAHAMLLHSQRRTPRFVSIDRVPRSPRLPDETLGGLSTSEIFSSTVSRQLSFVHVSRYYNVLMIIWKWKNNYAIYSNKHRVHANDPEYKILNRKLNCK